MRLKMLYWLFLLESTVQDHVPSIPNSHKDRGKSYTFNVFCVVIWAWGSKRLMQIEYINKNLINFLFGSSTSLRNM